MDNGYVLWSREYNPQSQALISPVLTKKFPWLRNSVSKKKLIYLREAITVIGYGTLTRNRG